jgi:hypothetical protein
MQLKELRGSFTGRELSAHMDDPLCKKCAGGIEIFHAIKNPSVGRHAVKTISNARA